MKPTEWQRTKGDDTLATPQQFYDELNNEFHFTLDPCSSHENHKCEKYYTIEDNGLLQDWGGEIVFCNPPYSQIGEWVEKCWEEGLKPNTTVVMLIPARTDTRWFHEFILNKAEIRYIRGRLVFGKSKWRAPFPSMVVIYRSPRKTYKQQKII